MGIQLSKFLNIKKLEFKKCIVYFPLFGKKNRSRIFSFLILCEFILFTDIIL